MSTNAILLHHQIYLQTLALMDNEGNFHLPLVILDQYPEIMLFGREAIHLVNYVLNRTEIANIPK